MIGNRVSTLYRLATGNLAAVSLSRTTAGSDGKRSILTRIYIRTATCYLILGTDIVVHAPHTKALSLANPHLICPLTHPAKRTRRKLNPEARYNHSFIAATILYLHIYPIPASLPPRLLFPQRPHSANTKPWATTPALSWTPLSKGPTVSPSPAWCPLSLCLLGRIWGP